MPSLDFTAVSAGSADPQDNGATRKETSMTLTRRSALAGLGGVSAITIIGRAEAQTVTLRSAEIHPAGYPTIVGVEDMGRRLAERSNGRFRIQVFHSAQLGQERDTIDQTRFGVIDMNRINMAPFNNLIPETNVPSLPFMFRDIPHMRKVMDGPIGDSILAKFEAHGLIGLAFYDSGARSMYNRVRPINSVADMRGMKIRVQQSDMFVALIQALGANATPMPFGEVFTSLQTGVIDGAENNWPSYESTRHFEVARYYSITEHSNSPEVLVMSKRRFDSLSAADKELVRATAKESVQAMRTSWDARERASEELVKSRGVQVNSVEKAGFEQATRAVVDRFANTPELRQLVERIKATT
jgi:tripartite ATP-independent transporter DctP family solute receptor